MFGDSLFLRVSSSAKSSQTSSPRSSPKTSEKLGSSGELVPIDIPPLSPIQDEALGMLHHHRLTLSEISLYQVVIHECPELSVIVIANLNPERGEKLIKALSKLEARAILRWVTPERVDTFFGKLGPTLTKAFLDAITDITTFLEINAATTAKFLKYLEPSIAGKFLKEIEDENPDLAANILNSLGPTGNYFELMDVLGEKPGDSADTTPPTSRPGGQCIIS